MRLQVFENNPNAKHIDTAVHILKNGGLIIYPTDTVYALGCDAHNHDALNRLAKIKNSKREKSPVSLICSSIKQIGEYTGQLDTIVFRSLNSHLPGPFTFILPVIQKLPKALGKRSSIGVRIPDHQIALALVESLGNPLASASLHDDDRIIDYTTDPDMIDLQWNDRVDLFLDSGYGNNLPSTVVDMCFDEIKITRQGAGNFKG